MPIYEIFGRRKPDEALTHAGALHAPDHDTALLLARETHFRHGEGVDIAVVKADDLHFIQDTSLIEHTVDQSYRRQEGYTGFREKRQRAREAAVERGLGELQKRSVPGKA
jgi:ring-1,2-phenylacetyl-CoA epoxidase subunit PaaB